MFLKKLNGYDEIKLGYEFMVECDSHGSPKLHDAIEILKEKCAYFQVISRAFGEKEQIEDEVVPWFPIRIRDLDRFANQILSYGAELDSDHPGFTDPVYRQRRKYFADIAYHYKHGEPVRENSALLLNIFNNIPTASTCRLHRGGKKNLGNCFQAANEALPHPRVSRAQSRPSPSHRKLRLQ